MIQSRWHSNTNLSINFLLAFSVVAFRKDNKLGVFLFVTPNKSNVDCLIEFCLKHDYIHTILTPTGNENKSQSTTETKWITHLIQVNLGNVQEWCGCIIFLILKQLRSLKRYSGWMKGFGIGSIPSHGQIATIVLPRHTTNPNCRVSSVTLNVSSASRRYSVVSSSTMLSKLSYPFNVPVASRPPWNFTRICLSTNFDKSTIDSFFFYRYCYDRPDRINQD